MRDMQACLCLITQIKLVFSVVLFFTNRLLTIVFISFMAFPVIFNLREVHAEDQSISTLRILDSAEKFFIYLKNGEPETAWNLLSDNSQQTIITDVYAASREVNPKISKQDVTADFNRKGNMFDNYWKAFLRNFDAGSILEHSLWEMGVINGDKAEIKLSFRETDGLTRLQMRREHGEWKVGLVETFWTRKKMKLLHSIFQLAQ